MWALVKDWAIQYLSRVMLKRYGGLAVDWLRANVSYTMAAVGVFLVILMLAVSCERAHAGEATFALGHTMLNSHMTVGEVGYRTDNRWEVTGTIIGEGGTKRGPQGHAYALMVSRVVEPRWSLFGAENYYRIGAGYVQDSLLIGNFNYRLGVGLDFDVFQLEYFHFSSAGINDVNTGVDGIQLRLPFTL